MKVIIVAIALVAVAAAAVLPDDVAVESFRSAFDPNENGGYDFNFETEKGIKRTEKGELRTVPDEKNEPHEVIVVRGEYSYIGKEGNSESIKYFADETGFHAEGPSIPVPVTA